MSPHRIVVVLAVVCAALVSARPAHAEWLRAETDHFIIYGDSSERGIRNYARKLETFDQLLRAYYPFPVDHDIPKLEIFMANGRRDMERASPGISATIGGFYSPNSSRIHAVADVSTPMSNDVIFHEYAHHFMFQMASNAYPAWFVEGFAEYYGTAVINEDRVQIARFNPGRLASLQQAANDWPPMEDVLRWRVSPSGRMRGADYYAISWALTHYLLSTPERKRQLAAYLAEVTEGGDPVQTLVEATGRTPEQLKDDLRRYVSGPITTLTPQIRFSIPEVTVSRPSPDEARLAWLDLRLDRADPRQTAPELERLPGEADEAFARRQRTALEEFTERRAVLVSEAAEALSAAPTSPAALRVAAKGLRLAGRPQEAADLLRPIAGPEATDPIALRLYGEALLDVVDAQAEGTDATPILRDARGALSQALEADPLALPTYLAIDRLRQRMSGYPSANDLSTLLVAMSLAPQSFDVRIRYARALMATGQPLQAISVLGPVVNSPHGGRSRATGRTLVAEARAQAGLEAAPADESLPVGDGIEEGEGA